MEEGFVDTSKVFVRSISKYTAEKIIVKNHYTHSFSACKYALGVYYRIESSNEFFDGNEYRLIGCLTFGRPVGRSALKSINESLSFGSVLELTRLFVMDGFGKNIESYVISQSFHWLKQNAKEVKVLISYADPEQNHLGRIYQATNWLYQGAGASALMPSYSIRLDETNKWIHSRTVSDRYGSSNIDHLKKCIGKTFYRKQEAFKHRYIYFLCDKKEKKKILSGLKHPIINYPKDPKQFLQNIETIEV